MDERLFEKQHTSEYDENVPAVEAGASVGTMENDRDKRAQAARAIEAEVNATVSSERDPLTPIADHPEYHGVQSTAYLEEPETVAEAARFDTAEQRRNERYREAMTRNITEWLAQMGVTPTRPFRYEGGDVFSVEITPDFFDDPERMVAGDFGLKGGAARELLLVVLGKKKKPQPRDVDLVRFRTPTSAEEQREEAAIADRYMPEDAAHGYAVDHVANERRSMHDAELTLNMVAWRAGRLFVTSQGLRDTVRGIVRLTPKGAEEYAEKPSKKIARAIAAYVRNVEYWGMAEFADELDEAMYTERVQPFWMALQIDRAFSVSKDFGHAVILQFQEHGFLSMEQRPEEILRWLGDNVVDFGFRHVSAEQLEREAHADRAYNDALDDAPPHRQGMGRGMPPRR